MNVLLNDLGRIPRILQDPCITSGGLVLGFARATIIGLIFAYFGTLLCYKPFMRFSYIYLMWCVICLFVCGYFSTLFIMLKIVRPSYDTFSEALSEYPKDPVLKAKIDDFQIEHQCCGVYSYQDWTRFNWTLLNLTETKNDVVLVPASCFSVSQNDNKSIYIDSEIDTRFVFGKEFPVYKRGCAVVVDKFFRKLAYEFAVHCGCVLVYQLLSIFLMLKFYNDFKEAIRHQARRQRVDVNDYQIEGYPRMNLLTDLRRRRTRFVPSEFMPHV